MIKPGRRLSRRLARAAGYAALALLTANFVLQLYCFSYARQHGLRQPTVSAPALIHFKGGPDLYVSRGLAAYVDLGFWAHFVLLAVTTALLFIGYKPEVAADAAASKPPSASAATS